MKGLFKIRKFANANRDIYFVIFLYKYWKVPSIIQWRNNELDGVSNHQPRDCLLNCLFRRRLKKNHQSWPLCGEFTRTGEFPALRDNNAENVSIWWRLHDCTEHMKMHQIHRPSVDSHHKRSVTRKMFPCKDIIMDLNAKDYVFNFVYIYIYLVIIIWFTWWLSLVLKK